MVFVIITTKSRIYGVPIWEIKTETQEDAAHSRIGTSDSAESEQIAV